MIKLKSLLSELTGRQKELKKDYLFKQTKLHSSNKIPSFEEIWTELKDSDGFRYDMKARMQDDDAPWSEEIENDIRQYNLERYDDIVYSYKLLDGKFCWREIILPQSVDPRTLNQLGIYWAVEEHAAESHWGKHTGSKSFKCTYEALIELKNVDWTGTMFSRMDITGGDDEKEIRFLKNAPLLVRKVKVYDNSKETSIEYFINNKRRA